VIPRVVILITAGLAFAVFAGLPARHLAGDLALVHCLAAVLLCGVPAVLTLAGTHWAVSHDPRQAGLLALAASGVRMFAVLLVALLLHLQVPLFQDQGFLFWVLAAYLYLLAVEVLLLVLGRRPLGQNTTAEPDAPAPAARR